MVVRYFDTDYMTYKTDEILFNGSEQDCINYIHKNWGVDVLAVDFETKIDMIGDLRHIRVSKTEWMHNGRYSTVEELENASPICDVRGGTWHPINVSDFIYNDCIC